MSLKRIVGAAMLLAASMFSAATCAAADADGADAVTSASVDATTGASKQLEPITVSGDFSVAYALNNDGAIFVLAADLTDAYSRDELASDSIFKGNLLAVKGVVEKASTPGAAKPWLTLAGDASSGKKVRCSLKKEQLSKRSVNPGDTVQVNGLCDGMKLSVSITEGEIGE